MISSALLLVAALTGPTALPGGALAEEGFAKGMIVSCPGAGKIWGSPDMAESLDELRELGVGWISIHPYAWIGKTGQVKPYLDGDSDYLRRAAALVRERGMHLFWKPHLGYWGAFEWRGAIEFGDDEASWQRFFADYTRFIVAQAALADELGVELFAVGVELDATLGRPEWASVIEEVRRVYGGQILYAANWDRVEAVPFWDRLDLVGVHAYFPLSGDQEPSRAALEAGWDRHLADLAALSKRLGGKKIVFAEIGYNRSSKAASEPWDYAVENTPANRELRRRLFDVALERLASEPILAGIFWWKWMPGHGRDRHDRNFSMKDEEALSALRLHWAPDSADDRAVRATGQ